MSVTNEIAATGVDEEKIDRLFLFKDADGKPKYYQHQRESIIQIIQAYLEGKRTVICDMPTGAGKSVCANTVMEYFGEGAWGATPKNTLVEQYGQLGWRRVKGAANYSCKHYKGSCSHGATYYRTTGKIPKEATSCCPECEYRADLVHFFDPDYHGGGMTNLHLFWHSRPKFSKMPRGLLVVDEAHLMESALADMVRVSVSAEDAAKANYSEPCLSEEVIEAWLNGYEDALKEMIEEQEEWVLAQKLNNSNHTNPLVKQAIGNLEKLAQQQRSLRGYSDYKLSTQWLPRLENNEDGTLSRLSLEPVYGGFLVRKLVEMSKRTLMMSATFLDKAHTCAELSLDEDSTAYIQVPSWFPKANQPMYFDGRLSLNFKNLEAVAPLVTEKIDRIIDYQASIGKPRGLVHSVSNRLTRLILKHTRHPRLFSIVDGGERQADAIKKHVACKESVLLGPAFVEGIDLKGTLGEWVCFPKVPFPPIKSDEKLKIRERDHPGYCDLMTCRTMVQGKGRVIRSADEVANSYCLDGNLSRILAGPHRHYLPSHFTDTISYTDL